MVFSTHRGVVAGRRVNNNEILEILRESDDGEKRREAWEASKTVGAAVADDVRELARLRNAAARTVGYRDWFALSLALSEMDEDEALRHARRGRCGDGRAVRALEARARRGACGPVRLRRRPSSLPGTTPTRSSRRSRSRAGSISGRCSPTVTRWRLSERTFTGIGLETRPVLDRSDLFPRDDKCQHAFCIDIDREGDVRVLANVVPGQYWLDTMLHELGHATFDGGIDSTLPWMLRDCHTVVTEGIAILMGRLAGDAEWLERVLGADADDVAAIAADLRAARAAEMLVFARWVLVMTNFERSLYADPGLGSRRTLVATRRALPAARRSERPVERRLGGEDSRRLRARLLPLLSLRPPRRLPALGDARAGMWRHRRPAGRRCAPARADLPPGPVGALGPAARAGDGRAADGDVLRAGHRHRLVASSAILSRNVQVISDRRRSPLEVPRPARAGSSSLPRSHRSRASSSRRRRTSRRASCPATPSR